MGDVTEGNALEILRQVGGNFIQSIKDAGLYDSIRQAFAAILPVQSVGVQGDQRMHSHVVVLRAITSEDGTTADCKLCYAGCRLCGLRCGAGSAVTKVHATC
ncbi:unnamed protein product [Musa textilis]